MSEKYVFHEEEDKAYYANFLKLLTRKVNEDEKFLSVFLNLKEPHFPLMLNLLRFYDCRDVVLHTTAKLSLMELCGNKSKAIQNYVVNFPFVMFYPLYLSEIVLSTSDYLTLT